MRNENEKKTVIKSMKISPDQEKLIMERAREKNMSFSAYMLDCALHKENAMTPEIVVQIQEIVNCAKRCVRYDENLLEADRMEGSVNKLWELLK